MVLTTGLNENWLVKSIQGAIHPQKEDNGGSDVEDFPRAHQQKEKDRAHMQVSQGKIRFPGQGKRKPESQRGRKPTFFF